MNIENIIRNSIFESIKKLYNAEVERKLISIENTRKDFDGDFTFVVFSILRFSKKPPKQTANEIGQYLKDNVKEIANFNVIKGFLNLIVDNSYWLAFLNKAYSIHDFGFCKIGKNSPTIMIEYSSPNTNKPLHLGHIRNNVLGYSVSNILKVNGNNVVKVNLVNDKGVHICKSMLAWEKWGNGETPQSSGMKGDHLVGKYYVRYDKEYKIEVENLVKSGTKKEDAEKKAPLNLEIQEMLRKWESGEKETIELWKTMNGWVYEGFDETYKRLGVDFDKIYYESETYLLGKSLVLAGLNKGIFKKEEDNSVWVDLTNEGLDRKILLRSDGTSVYITQDLGTAVQRFDEYNINKLIYVVGNEQDYHFKVLFKILEKLGYSWTKELIHLSYGMVELPLGKMKSREGAVVDADDLIEEMIKTVRETSKELGKLDNLSEKQVEEISNKIALGALKYFILKIDSKKNMLFNPKESIDLNGNTGPFIQYTYVRIQSLLSKAKDRDIEIPNSILVNLKLDQFEIKLIKLIFQYPNTINESGNSLNPAIIANYVYELVKEYNHLYQTISILKEKDYNLRGFRLVLSDLVGRIIKSSLNLLGIDVPKRM